MNLRLNIFIALFSIGIFSINSIFAQLLPAPPKKEVSDPEATKILKKLKDKYTALPAMYAEYVLTIDNRETKETQNGRMTQKGKKFHVDNNGNQIYCDGATIWMYMKNNNVVQINNFEEEEDPMSPGRLMKIYESEKEFIYAITNDDKSGVKCEIEFKPLSKDADFFKIRIDVDKIKNEVKYIKVFGKDGTTYSLDLKKLTGTTVDDSIFTFNKAKFPGVKIEDLR
jgi:outer membrane lipoprotein carrier protein